MSSDRATELCYLSATELLARYRRRDLSPVAVTEAILARIGRLNPRLNAFLTVTAERAIEDARAAERAYAPGGTPGPLAGVPLSIKDVIWMRGVPATNGAVAFRVFHPAEDAVVVRHLRAAGAIPVGKTNNAELCMHSRPTTPSTVSRGIRGT